MRIQHQGFWDAAIHPESAVFMGAPIPGARNSERGGCPPPELLSAAAYVHGRIFHELPRNGCLPLSKPFAGRLLEAPVSDGPGVAHRVRHVAPDPGPARAAGDARRVQDQRVVAVLLARVAPPRGQGRGRRPLRDARGRLGHLLGREPGRGLDDGGQVHAHARAHALHPGARGVRACRPGAGALPADAVRSLLLQAPAPVAGRGLPQAQGQVLAGEARLGARDHPGQAHGRGRLDRHEAVEAAVGAGRQRELALRARGALLPVQLRGPARVLQQQVHAEASEGQGDARVVVGQEGCVEELVVDDAEGRHLCVPGEGLHERARCGDQEAAAQVRHQRQEARDGHEPKSLVPLPPPRRAKHLAQLCALR
mmetsp:Transcript_91951/g.297552  ORF Transcript_91951/g.297552 Transcript_91951/m.297552 type:complete len:367 (+) Transcript_91951:31-1131(+)